MRTEIGRIAALSQRVGGDSSPLEIQVRHVAKLIGVVAVVAAIAFLPIGAAAGLSLSAAFSFSIALIVANVPEGLLPTITLALAVGVQDLARRGAVVKRLSAVETLGCTTVICTDKTGTLTQNRMQVRDAWVANNSESTSPEAHVQARDSLTELLATVAATCCTAELGPETSVGDPTELALLQWAESLGVDIQPTRRADQRVELFRFDATVRLMTTIDDVEGTRWIHTKGAPESVLDRTCTLALSVDATRPFEASDRSALEKVLDDYGRRGLRVLAVARRQMDPGEQPAEDRQDAETDLCLIGLIGLLDPPRPEAAAAIVRAHRAGLKFHVVTGDNGITAAEIARQVGIGSDNPSGPLVVTGDQLASMNDEMLKSLLAGGAEVVFARTSPEAKLRIADALRAAGQIVAMTGDGVNDAPALRAADIGVAMGLSGTEVARQAATMILTDDNAATIVDAVEQGRRVYDNVRKFILYIFTHAVPEVAPFLLFALAGGAIPLPLTVLQLLAIDLGTDTLPALALSREKAEPGLMDRPPRPPTEGVIRRSLLFRAWGFLGVVSAALVIGGYLFTLHAGGWHLSAPTGAGTPLHHVYRQATTVAWLGIVACQVGTAFAARTDRVSLRQVGVFSNRLLLGAIGLALCFAAFLIYVPALESIFGTAALAPHQLLVVAPFPLIVWGADEFRRWWLRRRELRRTTTQTLPPSEVGPESPKRAPVAAELV